MASQVIIKFGSPQMTNTILLSLHPKETYYYKVMPFGLKNVGATYERAMNYVFHNMMHDIMEDYVDDLFSKSRIRDQHWEVLEKVFQWLLKHNIRLNPIKCVCGVQSRKILDFIIS